MTVDAYVAEVLRRLPPQLIDRETVELDLRMHLLDRMEAGMTEAAAVGHMGSAEETAAELMSGVELVAVSFGRRVGGFMLDLMVGVVPLILMALLFAAARLGGFSEFRHGADADLVGVAAGGAFVFLIIAFALLALSTAVLSVLYFPVLEAVFGQTLGKRLVGSVVVKENGTTAGWMPAIVRRLPFLLEFFVIDAVFALFTQRKQRAFDKVAGTVVVHCRRGTGAA